MLAIEIFKISSQRIAANHWGNGAQPPTIAQGHCPHREQHTELAVPASESEGTGPTTPVAPTSPEATLSVPKRHSSLEKSREQHQEK